MHDRERLLEIASGARAEAKLTAELALYLFDHGLNPLTDVNFGPLRPDLLTSSHGSVPTLYVEAKQYEADGRRVVVEAMRQVWDTAGLMTAEPYEVHEAFLVVFRRGGPRLELPDVVRGPRLTVYPILIDIGNPSERGSRRAETPVLVTEAELAPTPDEPLQGLE